MTRRLEDFLTRYCESFRKGNAAVAAAFYHEPAVMIFADRMMVLDTRADITRTLDRILTELIERGFSHSVVDVVHVIPLTAGTALISATFSRLRGDGGVLERLGATYTVIEADGDCKIACIVAHAVDRVIRTV